MAARWSPSPTRPSAHALQSQLRSANGAPGAGRSGLTKPKARKVERLHEEVARKIGTAILNGSLASGATLGGEIESSDRMGVSRTAYREALKILVAKGLIESRPKAGSRITARTQWNLLDPDILAWMFTDQPDEKFVKDLFELRHVLEPVAAGLAAERRTPQQLAEMADCLRVMASAGLAGAEGQEADRQFHRLILAACCNEAIVSLGSSIGAAVRWTTHFKQKAQASPRDPLPEHEAVFGAIARGSSTDAIKAMQHLLTLALDDMNLAAAAVPAQR